MSADTDHRDAGVAFLKKTTATYPSWVAAGKPSSANWSKAFAEFDKIGAVVPPDPPPASGVVPPLPPANYPIPASAFPVRSTSELISALNAGRAEIVLEDGVYDNGAYVGTGGGKRLYARNLGKATVKFGLYATSDVRFQGIVFDCDAPQKTLYESIIRHGGDNLFFTDCWLKGGKKMAHGLYSLNPNGAVVRRCVVGGFTDTGVRLSSNHEGGSIKVQAVSDLDIDWVTRPVVNSSNGTAEAGLWVGELVTEGVHRIKVRNVSWSGIEGVNNCNATIFGDLDIDMSGILTSGLPNASEASRVGFYAEHFCVGGTIDRFIIVGCQNGFVGEWDDPVWGGRPAVSGHTIRNGTFKDSKVGAYYDKGSGPGNVLDTVHFENLRVGIGEYLPRGKATQTNLTFTNVIKQYSTEHYGGV